MQGFKDVMNCRTKTLMYVYAFLGLFWLVGWRVCDHLQKLLQRASYAEEVSSCGAWGKHSWGVEARSEKLRSRKGTFSTLLLCLRLQR